MIMTTSWICLWRISCLRFWAPLFALYVGATSSWFDCGFATGGTKFDFVVLIHLSPLKENVLIHADFRGFQGFIKFVHNLHWTLVIGVSPMSTIWALVSQACATPSWKNHDHSSSVCGSVGGQLAVWPLWSGSFRCSPGPGFDMFCLLATSQYIPIQSNICMITTCLDWLDTPYWLDKDTVCI